MNRELMFSRKSDEWATPQDFFDRLDAEFEFTLDPCATEENHKTPAYYTAADDGLQKNWGGSEYSAIHRTPRYQRGYRSVTKNHSNQEPWLCFLFRQERIQDIFTITSYTGARSGSLRAG